MDFGYDSSYGPIHSKWSVTGKKATWKLMIPPNTKGRLDLTPEEMKTFQLNGQTIEIGDKAQAIGKMPGEFELAAGRYQFEVTLP